MATKRNRWTTKQARAVLADAAASGLNITDFSRQRGLDPKRLHRWRGRLGQSSSPSVPRMVELVGLETLSPAVIKVHCPSGHRLEVSVDGLEAGLRAVLAAVAELGIHRKVVRPSDAPRLARHAMYQLKRAYSLNWIEQPGS